MVQKTTPARNYHQSNNASLEIRSEKAVSIKTTPKDLMHELQMVVYQRMPFAPPPNDA